MNKFSAKILVVSLGLGMFVSPFAFAAGQVHAFLEGFEQVPTLFSPATGKFAARLSESEEAIEYTLSYEGFETNVTVAHIHFGRSATTGGIIAFLCDTENGNEQEAEEYGYENEPAPVDTPVCPSREGTVSGIITAEDVIGPAEQGIERGEFHKLLESIAADAAYVNVHSEAFPPGEIRGQLAWRFRHVSSSD